MPNIELKKTTVVLALAIAASVSANMLGTVGAQGPKTAIPTLSPTQSQSPTKYVVRPLLSVGDRVPETSDPSKQYQMVGIPDGLGAHKGHGNQTVLYMNELSAQIRVRLSSPEVTMIDH